MDDKRIIETKEIKEVFALMQEYGIESSKGEGMEIKRESLKILQAENELSIEMERTKRSLKG